VFVLLAVDCNFPSSASDHVERVIDISELLISNKIATFLVLANSLPMLGVGIEVDAILIAEINNELLVNISAAYNYADHLPYRKTMMQK
jgi:hypothetical protein